MKKYIFYVSLFDINNLHAQPRMVYEICKRHKNSQKIIYTTGDRNLEYRIAEDIKVFQFNYSLFNVFKKIKERTAEEDIDKIIFFGSILGAFALLHFIKSTKIILYLYEKKASLRDFFHLKWVDIFYEHRSNVYSYYSILLFFPNFLIRYLLQKDNLEAMVVPSFRLEKWFKKICPKVNVVRIAGGVDYERFQNIDAESINKLRLKLNPQNKKVILYLGHIRASRGLDEVIQISRRLSEEGYNIKLLMVLNTKWNYKYGNYFKNKYLKNTDKKFLDAEIIFEHVKDTRYYYAIADFVVLPYRFAPPLPEYPLVLLEAMCSGSAICAYNIGAIGEVVKDGINGVLAEVGDYRELCQKIKSLLNNPEKQKLISQKAKFDSKIYDWKHFYRLTNKLLIN